MPGAPSSPQLHLLGDKSNNSLSLDHRTGWLFSSHTQLINKDVS